IASGDTHFAGPSMQQVTVVNKEADVAGFTVTPTAIQTSMTGASATFSVALNTIPTSQVQITLTTNLAEGSLSQSVLTFDSSNWNTPQPVTVTGKPDTTVTQNVVYQITGSALSGDLNYDLHSIRPACMDMACRSSPTRSRASSTATP